MPSTPLRASHFRTFGLNESSRLPLRRFLCGRLALDDKACEAITTFLLKRSDEVRGRDTFGIVYDITRICNLECAHCCVNAIFMRDPGGVQFETTTAQVRTILKRVYDYAAARAFPNVFLIFGGGEPTLRPDFEDIAGYACSLFGQRGVGINTNGTALTLQQLKRLSRSLGFIEISIDGFEANHNAWRDPRARTEFSSPYQKTLDLVKQIVADEELAPKLEVSSAVTTDNILELRAFAQYLASLEVKHYSIHRAMPVGRMGHQFSKIPTMDQYIRLLLDVAWLRTHTSLKSLHLHHSLETIYSVLFLGYDIHASSLLAGSGRHSVGIDPYGNVYFDPWCVVPPFATLVAGNLLAESTTLQEIVEADGSLIRLADETAKQALRCRGCRMKCSGGMRFNALGHFLFSRFGDNIYKAQVTDMIAGLSEIDPACPLYEP